MHHASARFWQCYHALPAEIRESADKQFALLKANPAHPSLHFKKVGKFWSARLGHNYRALAVAIPTGYLWFWIGTHAEYEAWLGRG